MVAGGRNQSFFSSITSANPATIRIRYFHRLSHREFASNSELNADAPAGIFGLPLIRTQTKIDAGTAVSLADTH
jgi:hypothetical protein